MRYGPQFKDTAVKSLDCSSTDNCFHQKSINLSHAIMHMLFRLSLLLKNQWLVINI